MAVHRNVLVFRSVLSHLEEHNLLNQNTTSIPTKVIIIGYVRRTPEESDHVTIFLYKP